MGRLFKASSRLHFKEGRARRGLENQPNLLRPFSAAELFCFGAEHCAYSWDLFLIFSCFVGLVLRQGLKTGTCYIVRDGLELPIVLSGYRCAPSVRTWVFVHGRQEP